MTQETARDPHVQVVRGTPDDVELAALVAGLVAAASAGGPAEDESPSVAERAARTRWVVPAARRAAGALPPRGHDAWRWSLRG